MSQKEAPQVGLLNALVAGRLVSHEVAAALQLSETPCPTGSERPSLSAAERSAPGARVAR